MNREKMQIILDKIKVYRRIILFRHIRCDGDAVGATKGLREILRLSYPEKEIYLIDEGHSAYLDFLGGEDEPIPDALYADALAIVLDTGSADRISNPKYTLCREIVKIDHHLERDPYGDISWVESDRSSTCEMVVKFYDTFRGELKMSPQAAAYLYTGMVTDSGRFRFRSVSGDTLRYAAMLLDQGIDTETLYAHLYLQDADELKFKAYVLNHLKFTENGAAYCYISRTAQEKFGLSLEQASNAVSYLDSIKGSLIWIALIETGDEKKTIRVRLRSRFAAVNEIAERWRGGGHTSASGATVYGRREVNALLAEADDAIRIYKETHEGWL